VIHGGTIGTRGSANTYSGVTGLLQSGRNGGDWSGDGIVTSMSAATNGVLTSLGIATAQQSKNLATANTTTTWSGQTVTGSDVLVMYTYGGDANLDGKIDIQDYGRIDLNFPLGVSGWFNGDFNYDGKINILDYGIIDFNIAIQGPPFSTGGGVTNPLAIAVPEPGSATLLFGFSGFLCRRRRGRG